MSELRFFQLEAFVAAADHGSFSQAARALRKAQSAVSTAISNLEIDLGVELFDRNGKYPVLTPHGENLLREAREILLLGQKMQHKADGFCHDVEASLTIALEECMPFGIVQNCLKLFEKKYPQVDIHILTVAMREAENLVNSGEADLGFVVDFPPPSAHKNMMEICHFTAIAVVSQDHPLAAFEYATHEDLFPYRQILYGSKEGGKEDDDQIFSGQVWYVDSCHVAQKLVTAGLGWSHLPHFMTEDCLKKNHLKTITIIGETSSIIPVVMVWSPDAPMGPAASFLVDLFIEHAATSPSK